MTVDRIEIAPHQMASRRKTARELHGIMQEPLPHGIVIQQGDRAAFHIAMQADYLTARGERTKFQHLEAEYTREVTDIMFDVVARTRYVWDRVLFTSVTGTEEPQQIEWTFARGQRFRFVLLAPPAAQYLSSDLAKRDPDGESVRKEIAKREGLVEVAYADLPRTAAVDLLVMLSWDVVTFENLLSHLMAEPGLQRVGARCELGGLSGSSTQLGLSQYRETLFCNGTVTAEFQGYGRAAGRPCSIFTFEATPSQLQVGTDGGEVRQEGTSFYSGRLLLDVESGDVCAGHMVESVVAVTMQVSGKPKATNVRRHVWLNRTPPY